MVEILNLANGWSKQVYSGLYFHMDKDKLGTSLTIYDDYGLEGAAAKGTGGIKKETINGKEYYTRLMYIDSATSTYPNDYEIYVYAMDAPAGTIMTDINNQVYPSHQQWGATMYEVPTPKAETTSLNANGSAYTGAFKLCIPVDNVTNSGAITVQTYAVITQFNLYLANNPDATEQSYIIADPAYVGRFAKANIKWSSAEQPDTANLQVQKVDGSAMPLEGAEFTLTGSKGTTRTGISDENGMVEWTELPVDETYILTESKAPAGFSVVAPRNITLTAGQTAHVTIQDDTNKHFIIKKIDEQNGAALEGAVFSFEQIDGTYKTTATTGFDGMLEFSDELPYGSYRVSEERAPTGYEKDAGVQTVHWDGTKDVLLTFQDVRKPTIVGSKVDGITGVSLPGATFDVYKDGQKIGSVTTNDAGEFRFPIEGGEGYFEFVETVAPEGYVLDRTPHGIHVDPYDPQTEDDPVLTIENFSRPALRIIKYDQKSGDRLPGVTFEIYRDADLFDTATTDAEGEIVYFDLEPGTYLVKEVSTDDAHVVTSTPQQIELPAGQTKTATLIFFNSLKPGIHLAKVDSVTMKSLPNVRFEFKKVGGSYRQEFTTDINGEIDLSKLEPGSYEVRELETPNGYLMDDAVRVVQINPDENANFVFSNTPKPALRLIKTSSDGTRLGGVHFRVVKIEDGTHYLDRITDDNGEINIPNLDPGVYSVKETATVADHILDIQEYHVELFPGQTSTITIENQVRPNLTVYKHDADTGDPIPETVFLVKAADGHSVDEIKTDSEGRATLSNLLPGVYEVSEKSVPAPWLMDAGPQLITLYPNRDHTVYFKNHKKPTLTVNKVDSVTGSPIKGAKFEVWYGSNSTTTGELNSLGTFYSDTNGQFFVDLLRDGWYRVTELEPAAGFTIKEPATQEFYIKGGESKSITFENVPKSAIAVEKYDSVTGEALPGCTFQLKYLGGTSGTGGTVIGQKVTGKNGTAIWTGLNPGAYILEEVDPADGYSIIQSSETVMLADSGEQSVVTVRFTNAPDGSLLIRKVCSVNPGVTLSGAEFKVTYADGTVVGDANGIYRSDANGEVLITGLKPGKSVIVTETRAPAGFLIDTRSQTVQLKEGRTVTLTFANQPKGAIIIQKRGPDNEVLEGVEFRLTTAAGCEVGLDGVIGDSTLTQSGIFRTDSQGEIKVSNLAPGAYVISEISTKEGYVITNPSTNVVIGPNGDTQTVVIKNDRLVLPDGVLILIVEQELDLIDPLSSHGIDLVYDDPRESLVGHPDLRGLVVLDGEIGRSGVQPVTLRRPGLQQIVVAGVQVDVGAAVFISCHGIHEAAVHAVDLKRGIRDADAAVILVDLVNFNAALPLIPEREGLRFPIVLDQNALRRPVQNESVNGLDLFCDNGRAGREVREDNLAVPICDELAVAGSQRRPGAVGNEERHARQRLILGAFDIFIDGERVAGNVIDGDCLRVLRVDGDGLRLRFRVNGIARDGFGLLDDHGARDPRDPDLTVFAGGVEALAAEVAVIGVHILAGGIGQLELDPVQRLICELIQLADDQCSGLLVIEAEVLDLTLLNEDGLGRAVQHHALHSLDLPRGHGDAGGQALDHDAARLVSHIFAVGVANYRAAGVGDQEGHAFQRHIAVLRLTQIFFDHEGGGRRIEEAERLRVVAMHHHGLGLGAGVDGVTRDGAHLRHHQRAYHALDGDFPFLIGLIEAVAAQLAVFVRDKLAAGGGDLEGDALQRLPGEGALLQNDELTRGLVPELQAYRLIGFDLDGLGRIVQHIVFLGPGLLRHHSHAGLQIVDQDGPRAVRHIFAVGIAHDLAVAVGDQKLNVAQRFSGDSIFFRDEQASGADDQGYIYIDDVTVAGKGRLYIRELEAAPGYELDKQYKTIYVQPGKTVEIEWENTPITGQIQVWKYAAEYNEVTSTPAGAPLQGAVYEISNPRTGKVVDYITTDARGVAASKPLPLGRYKIVEVTAPAYWQLSGTVFDETLEYSGQIIKVSDYDKPSNLGVTITKRGNAEVLSDSSMRYDFTVANTSNVPLENFYWHDRIPTDAARATVLTTGTYSARLNYRILYKTNYTANYQVLASNLLTNSSYSFSLNAIPTQAGEYVTDIYFDFGKVPVGFQSVANPTLTVVVSGTAANGYQLINRADVGGKYQGTWQTAQATWVTIIRKLTPSPKLPKTGY